MIALFGLFFSVLAMFYSAFLHIAKLRVAFDANLAANLILVWVILIVVPIAIKIESTFLGYISFMCLFTILGFRMFFFGLGIGIGWDDEATCERSASSSAFILACYIGFRLADESAQYLNPFRSAICVLGGNILFLAMLIISSTEYHYKAYHTMTSS
jgi:hypothetical protein